MIDLVVIVISSIILGFGTSVICRISESKLFQRRAIIILQIIVNLILTVVILGLSIKILV